ncbi:hypothetical protein D9M69_715130 [compost metagenome]
MISAIASFWLQRFWAMMIPTAVSMMVRDSIAAFRFEAVSVCWAKRMARRRPLEACRT